MKHAKRTASAHSRRNFLLGSSRLLAGLAVTQASSGCVLPPLPAPAPDDAESTLTDDATTTLFLTGDVMTGRGVDQILPHSVDPVLYESYVKDARVYVDLAEEASGPIPDEVSYDYIWGEALAVLAQVQPAVRIINLETAVTTNDEWWPGKGIHYRMHPQNVPLFTTADIDVCVLGNNHVLDWGYAGLVETLAALQDAGLHTPGAGLDLATATAPTTVETATGRLLIFSYGTPSAGVPLAWQAGVDEPGVNLLVDPGVESAQAVIEAVEAHRGPGDRVVISIHWGGNWGYDISPEQRAFAHQLIDAGAADVIHGHSSHHPKGIEVYRNRPIFYGCGDFINDYEGIRGHEEFRPELTLMYFPTIDESGDLVSLVMAPMRIYQLQLIRADGEEARWLAETLDRESQPFGTRVELTEEGQLVVHWEEGGE